MLFNVNETDLRLANTDAEYVQIIHTDTDGGRFALGIDEPVGHGMRILLKNSIIFAFFHCKYKTKT